MVNQSMNDLIQIREAQKKEEQEKVDALVQQSQDDFKRRLEDARLDPSIHLNEEEK